jgi:hypothetical protein
MARAARGVAEMKNSNVTKWLEMVWTALVEQDQGKRNQLLYAANLLLRGEDPQLDTDAHPMKIGA